MWPYCTTTPPNSVYIIDAHGSFEVAATKLSSSAPGASFAKLLLMLNIMHSFAGLELKLSVSL